MITFNLIHFMSNLRPYLCFYLTLIIKQTIKNIYIICCYVTTDAVKRTYLKNKLQVSTFTRFFFTEKFFRNN